MNVYFFYMINNKSRSGYCARRQKCTSRWDINLKTRIRMELKNWNNNKTKLRIEFYKNAIQTNEKNIKGDASW